jgi:sterol desaturase/sphingolipid hydroxylase (fatty acid hydroxylase superfamily)
MVTRRTTMGVFVGWAGMVVALIWAMLWVPVTFLPFLGYDMKSYPWITLIIGTIVAVALLKYSRSTLHSEWISSED